MQPQSEPIDPNNHASTPAIEPEPQANPAPLAQAPTGQPEPPKSPAPVDNLAPQKVNISKAPKTDHHVIMAIAATVIIVVVLAVLAVYAYQKK
ncbi:MAG TPA: hypothetical protein VFN31_03000 [Candidatus Saccharimonadales bacterium]|nr:hypothetical protein [Candidatus Saccharimonadales bacterium]